MKKQKLLQAFIFIFLCAQSFNSLSQFTDLSGNAQLTDATKSIIVGPLQSPSSTLHFTKSDPSITLNNTNVNPSGSTGLYFRGSGQNFSIYNNWFPACGSGRFHITPTSAGSKGIHFDASGINFSNDPNYGTTCSSFINATYRFDATVGMPSLAIGSNSPAFSIPSGFSLGVQGSSYFGGNVSIGSTSTPSALLNVYNAANPNVRISETTGILEMGVASCNGCYSAFAVPGNSVIRPMNVVSGSGLKRLILSTGTDGGGSSIDFNSDVNQIMRVSDLNYVSIGTLTLPALAPTGGYRFGVLGNANINGSLVVGDPATITSITPFPSGYNLYVTQGILTEKVKVALKNTTDWSDFVFATDYKLISLDSVATYIKENKHLPDVPSAEEVVNNGIDLAKMDAKLLQKIEELTLYIIEMEKEIEALKAQVNK